MKGIRLAVAILHVVVIFGSAVSAADGVKAWRLPRGPACVSGSRDGWAPANAGSEYGNGAALENDLVLVSVQPGAAGPVLHGKRGGTTVQLSLADTAGKCRNITGVTDVRTADDAAVIRVTAGSIRADIALKPNMPFVGIRLAAGTGALDIGIGSMFVMMPDFFAMDMGFDARRMAGDKATVLADNFYLHMVDGGEAMVMPVWPGVKPGEAREESTVDLFLEGDGDKRRVVKGRVAFEKNDPVYVAVLEGKNYWRMEDISDWAPGKARKSEWIRPFEARWRASMFTKDGRLCQDWNVAILSDYFPEPRLDREKHKDRVRHTNRGVMFYHDEMLKGNIWWPTDGVPQGNAQGMWGYKRHCWFIGKDTYLYPYISAEAGKIVAKKNQEEKRKAAQAQKEGKEYAPRVHKIENDFETAILYPMDRAKDTPLDVHVPVDVVREILGVGPCEYILDKEGVTVAYHGGARKMHFEGATCGNWDSKLNPLLKKWEKEGKISDKERQDVVWLIEDMGTFITAVNERFRAYGGFLDTVEKICAGAKKESGAGTFIEAVRAQLDALNGQIRRIPEFDRKVEDWNKKIPGYMEKAAKAAEFPKDLKQVGNVRQVAGPQDTAIATCRRCVNAIRQAAGLALAAGGSDETAELAARIREECRKIMRNPHPLERY